MFVKRAKAHRLITKKYKSRRHDVTIGSDASLGRGARAGLDGVNAQLRAREEDKRNHSVVQRLLNEAGNNTIFTPIVMSAFGAMGQPMVAFLKG